MVDMEVLKSQKFSGKPHEFCDPCNTTVTGSIKSDIKEGKVCINKDFKQLLQVMSEETQQQIVQILIRLAPVRAGETGPSQN